ncbi:MAG: hypothetical protein QOI42_859 [Frankiaceae bacterium]|nr:hypothetical protein [Frankiaceae bacterium]
MDRTLPDGLRALRHRNFRRWLAADVVSIAGWWMQIVAQNWLVLQISGSAAQLGWSVAAQSAPALVLGLWAGSLVDRLPRRSLLLVTQSLSAVLAFALAALAASGGAQVWMVNALAVATGIVGLVNGPAAGAFGQEMVGRDDMVNAAALGSASNSLGRVLGLALAGIVVAAGGPALAFAINGVSFLAVIGALCSIRTAELVPLRRAPRSEQRVRDGVAYVLRQPRVLVVLGLSFLLGAFGRNFQVTMAAMAAGPLHAGSYGYGLASTVFAGGAFVGAFLAARAHRARLAVILTAACCAAVVQLLSAGAPSELLFAAAMAPIAAAAVLLDTQLGTWVALSTDESRRGCVAAAAGMASAAAGAVGAPALGWFCSAVGPRLALVIGGVIALCATAVAAVVLLRLAGTDVLAYAATQWQRRSRESLELAA